MGWCVVLVVGAPSGGGCLLCRDSLRPICLIPELGLISPLGWLACRVGTHFDTIKGSWLNVAGNVPYVHVQKAE